MGKIAFGTRVPSLLQATVAAIASALTAAFLISWIAGYWSPHAIGVFFGPGAQASVASVRGRLDFEYVGPWHDPEQRRWASQHNPHGLVFEHIRPDSALARSIYSGGHSTGFGIDHPHIEGLGLYNVFLPQWLCAALSAAAAFAAFRALRARQIMMRLRMKLCVRCAYDLRATPGRCPECGTVVEPAGHRPGTPVRR
ncbi:MAG: hypothetical protein JWP03_1043 [Phycisphaerales bacterium]|nr:hypothetical protein [Phycisphaerales bacterium]